MSTTGAKSSINNRLSRLRSYNSDRFLRVDLTKKSILEVLYLLGKHGEMTSTEIRHKLEKSPSRYVYELLENLYPPEIKRMRLFVFEDFIDSKDSERIKLFQLIYPLAEPFWKISNYDLDNIDVKVNGNKITFNYDDDKKIVIDVSVKKPFLRVFDKEKYCIGEPLIVETKNNKSHIYMELGFSKRLNYVDHYYDTSGRYVYALNLLGFLLIISDRKKISKQKIHEIISNPNIANVVPFLESWADFNDIGFDVLEELLSIGEVYRDQILNCDSNILLGFRVTQRYLKRLEDWFTQTELNIFPPDKNRVARSSVEYEKLQLYMIHVTSWQRFRLLGLLTSKEIEHDRWVNSYINIHPSASNEISTYR
jgi:hypothetical protein